MQLSDKTEWAELLLSPSVVAVGVGADVVQLHLRLGALRVRLEEDALPVATLRAGVVLGPR